MHEVKLAGRTLQKSAHVCVFFNSDDEKYRALLPFIKDGIEAGDKAFHMLDPETIPAHVCCMRSAGIDVDRAMGTKQLEVLPWEQTYLVGGRFDASRMIAAITSLLDRMREERYPLTRFIGGMEWALVDRPGVAEIVEYESRVNELFSQYDLVAVCAYDLRKHKASVVMDILRTHPFVIIGGILQDNPFYVPPGEFMQELRSREPDRAAA